MRFIDKDDKLRFIGIAFFRTGGVQLSKQLQHESREQLGTVLQISNAQHRYHAAAIGTNAHEIIYLKAFFAKENIGALLLQLCHLSKDGAGGGGRYLTVILFKLRLAFI